MRGLLMLSAILALPVVAMAQSPASQPQVVGQCVRTTVAQVSNRLENGPGSGSAVLLANRLSMNGYEQLKAIDTSRRGDPVLACLVHIETGCRKPENAGRDYTVTNLRTVQSWTLGDSSSTCHGE